MLTRFVTGASPSVDALVERSTLPAELRELVRRIVRDAGRPEDDSLDVAEELLWHFEDGLARGVDPAALAAAFGPPDRAAVLIRRSRQRLAPWRRRGVLTAAVLMVLSLGMYISSAVTLHAERPVLVTPRSASGPRDVPRWVRGADRASAARERTRARLRNAKPAERPRAIVANLADAAALRRERSFEADLAAIDIIHEALASSAGEPVSPTVVAALERAVAPDGRLLRPDVVRAAYDDLLDRVYSSKAGSARVTARGLRVLQAIKGKTHPGVGAIVLEPVYFALPARRWEVEREIRAVTADAIAAAHSEPNAATSLRYRQDALRRGRMKALRHFPLTVTLDRLTTAADHALETTQLMDAVWADRPGVP